MKVEIYKCYKSKYVYKVHRKNLREKEHKKKIYCPFCFKFHSFVKIGG